MTQCKTENIRKTCYVKSVFQIHFAVEQFSLPFFKVIFGRTIELSSKYFTHIHCLFMPLIMPQNLLSRGYLKQNNLDGFIGAQHRSFFSWSVDFLTFKKRRNTSLYVQYSWTYDFLLGL